MLGHMFREVILKRGYQYFIEGRVNGVVKRDSVYYGTVDGSNNYNVEIEIGTKDKVVGMSCSCPYAKDGAYCKHEAAMLFQLFGVEKVIGTIEDEEDEYDEFDDYDEYEDYDFDDDYVPEYYNFHEDLLIGRLERKSKHELIDILNQALTNNQVYTVIDHIVEKDESFQNVESLIYKQISSFKGLKKNDFDEIIKQIDNLQKYHDQVREYEILKKCIIRMLNVYQDMGNIERQMTYQLFIRLENYQDHDYDFECEFYLDFNQPIVYEMIDYIYKRDHTLIPLFNKLVNKFQNEYRPHKKKYIEKIFYLVTHYHLEKLDEIMKLFENERDFLQLLISYKIQEKEYDEACILCEKGIKIYQDIIYYDLLLKIYKETAQKDELIKLYKYIISKIRPGNIHYYLSLKECYLESEWKKVRILIIEQLESLSADMIDIYLEEKMYNRLMDYFEQSKDYIRVRRYENILMTYTPQRLIKFYEVYINKTLKDIGTREFYRSVLEYFEVILKVDKEKGMSIYRKLNNDYPKRKALLEELERCL